jgi:hypothetical protein
MRSHSMQKNTKIVYPNIFMIRCYMAISDESDIPHKKWQISNCVAKDGAETN